jgi:hypothetical protein
MHKYKKSLNLFILYIVHGSSKKKITLNPSLGLSNLLYLTLLPILFTNSPKLGKLTYLPVKINTKIY